MGMNRKGQATVELALSLPVAIVTLLIVVNALWFGSVASAFDHAMPQAVLDAIQDTPFEELGSDVSGIARTEILRRLEAGERFSVEVHAAHGGSDFDGALGLVDPTVEYVAVLTFRPWPAVGANVSIGGTGTGSLFELKRTRSLTVSSYRPGSL